MAQPVLHGDDLPEPYGQLETPDAVLGVVDGKPSHERSALPIIPETFFLLFD